MHRYLQYASQRYHQQRRGSSRPRIQSPLHLPETSLHVFRKYSQKNEKSRINWPKWPKIREFLGKNVQNYAKFRVFAARIDEKVRWKPRRSELLLSILRTNQRLQRRNNQQF